MGSDVNSVCCATVFIMFVTSCFLLGYSFDTVGPHEMGFVYDSNIQKHEWDEMYNARDGTGGRFYLGLGRTFKFPFPRDVQRLLFANEQGATSGIIIAKSVEGIDIEISCSVLYQLRREPAGLRALFERYGGVLENDAEAEEGDEEPKTEYAWTKFFVQSMRGSLRDVMGRFNATSLWKNRTGLRAAMRAEITPFLEANHAELRGFQLLNMDIPRSLSNSILATTVEGERVLRASTELVSINETVITDVQVQARLAQLQLLTAQAQAVELNTASQAEADALRLNIEAEAQAVQTLKSLLSLNTTEYLALLHMDTVAAAEAGQKRVGVVQPEQTQPQ